MWPAAALAAALWLPRPPAHPPADPRIAAAERQYRQGLALYRDGQLAAARQAFDAAVDGLLAPLGGAAPPPPLAPDMQAELQLLLDRIRPLEMDALVSGNGLARPRPALTADADEETFPIDAAARARVAAEVNTLIVPGELPLPVNDTVVRAVQTLARRDHDDLALGFRRAGRYMPMIERVFRAAGVPLDLIYIAQTESDFDPRCITQGARGMWQFMPSRADDYHLRRTVWVDERQDPEKSTRAAAAHLKDLYELFGDWLLAVAAYNAGPEAVQRAVAATGFADFWQLAEHDALPRVTENYVPDILATALIARHAADYGLDDVAPDPPIETDDVAVAAALDLRLAADCAGATLSDLRALNPALLHTRAPAGYALHLPSGAAARFAEALATVPAMDRLSWRVHWLREGETLTQVAGLYGVTTSRLRAANHLDAAAEVSPGTPLAVPQAAP